jgi:hypothetical protein
LSKASPQKLEMVYAGSLSTILAHADIMEVLEGISLLTSSSSVSLNFGASLLDLPGNPSSSSLVETPTSSPLARTVSSDMVAEPSAAAADFFFNNSSFSHEGTDACTQPQI